MQRKISFILILMSLGVISFAQGTGTVRGKVTDLQGNPVQNLTVFIPSTSIGTTTNSEGEYSLKNIPAGLIKLVFRHLAYKPENREVGIESGVIKRLDIQIEESTLEIDEVVKKAESSNWKLGYERFKEYVLGDPKGRTCKLENPKDIYFYYDGEVLAGHAVKPLRIVNKYLGYEILYYLDYFKFIESPDSLKKESGGYYMFSGSGLYKQFDRSNFIQRRNWKKNREREFGGSLQHFLISLYFERQHEMGYTLRETWASIDEMQKARDISPGLAYVQSVKMDSVFNWDYENNTSKYMYFFPDKEPDVREWVTDLNQVPPRKSLKLNNNLIILYDMYGLGVTEVSKVIYLNITKNPGSKDEPELLFNSRGQYEMKNGTLSWSYLDNLTRLVQALPVDYGDE